ncbi:hypothetical protein [Puniceicoccus vermicola]|uniref:Serine protease n=1 Tax=Puniceicoccus vermicola TaxID=388746 RepID=A0A7X1E4N6_9BACT|nr:hypothetical protein [Puniceicoccus vermicola]MBC2602193.1 hypothetical protein [Puniceicoccus vermicola]
MFLRKCFDLGSFSREGMRVSTSFFALGLIALFALAMPAEVFGAEGDAKVASAPSASDSSESAEASAKEGTATNEDAGTVDSTESAVPGEAGTADENAAPESGEATEEVVEVVEESPFVSPQEALVAVRGDAKVGLGVLATYEERTVVVTSLSALNGSRRILVNTAGGQEVPIVGVIGVKGKDMAFLAVDSAAADLPVAELNLEGKIEKDDSVRILNPRREIKLKVRGEESGRIEIGDVEGPVFAGSPVVVGKQVIGVFSPARLVGTQASSGADSTVIWNAGIVPFSSSMQWEPIDLATMALESETLDDCLSVISQVGSFLKVSGFKGEVSMQRLLVARDRLKDDLARSSQAVEKDNARKKFAFSVRSSTGSVQSDLQGALNNYYSYFDPEVTLLVDLYRPVHEKIQDLNNNLRKADSFAR